MGEYAVDMLVRFNETVREAWLAEPVRFCWARSSELHEDDKSALDEIARTSFVFVPRDDEEAEAFDAQNVHSCAPRVSIDERGHIVALAFSRAGLLGRVSFAGLRELRHLSISAGDIGAISLDVSENTALRTLECRGCGLASLDVSRCRKLTFLDCDCNDLAELDVSSCADLTTLYCGANLLTSLDVAKCKKLKTLGCGHSGDGVVRGRIERLDLSANAALEWLECDSIGLKSLDLSGCAELRFLSCEHNEIRSLDVSHCKRLERIEYDADKTAVIGLDCAALS